MPEGFPIDRKTPLDGIVPNYTQHVLVCTGKDDWPSKIEEDNGGDNLAANLRELVGRGGFFKDKFHNLSILNASFPSSPPPRARPDLQTTSAYLVPSFQYVPFLPHVSFEDTRALFEGYLLPKRLHPRHGGLSPVHRDSLRRKDLYRRLLPGVQSVGDVLVLICGHGGRDPRCGVYGPLLRAEFEVRLAETGFELEKGPVKVESEVSDGEQTEAADDLPKPNARVGLISHIGGHKFAGNVIIYIPPNMKSVDGSVHALAGRGIWYGRVEPRHVEGLCAETIRKGNVIADLCRGGINMDGTMIRSF